jgi:hypothetical protein
MRAIPPLESIQADAKQTQRIAHTTTGNAGEPDTPIEASSERAPVGNQSRTPVSNDT